MEVLHLIFLVCICPVDIKGFTTKIVLLRVCMLEFTRDFDTTAVRGLTMFIGWEKFSESISHLQFAIECPTEESLIGVQRAICHRMSCSWRVRVISIFIW